MRPVVAVKALADLRAHVGQEEGVVHGVLAPFRIRRGHLVAAVVAGAEVVLQLAAELFGDRGVLEEDGVLAVAVGLREGGGCDVLCYPGGVAQAAVEGGD